MHIGVPVVRWRGVAMPMSVSSCYSFPFPSATSAGQAIVMPVALLALLALHPSSLRHELSFRACGYLHLPAAASTSGLESRLADAEGSLQRTRGISSASLHSRCVLFPG